MTQQVTEHCISNLRTAFLVAVTMAKKGEFDSEEALKEALKSKQVSNEDIDEALDYFERSGMFVRSSDKSLTWIFYVNQKLERIFSESEKFDITQYPNSLS